MLYTYVYSLYIALYVCVYTRDSFMLVDCLLLRRSCPCSIRVPREGRLPIHRGENECLTGPLERVKRSDFLGATVTF